MHPAVSEPIVAIVVMVRVPSKEKSCPPTTSGRIGVKFKNDAQRLSASKTTLCDRLVPECEACIVDDHTDDTDAEERLVCLRWPNGVRCVNCGSAEVVEGQRHRRLRMWRCGCGKDFSVTTGTALHSSKLSLSAWETAARSPDDSSSGLLALLGVSAVTARRVSRVLRSVPAPPGDARVAALLSAPKTPSHDADDPLAESPESHRVILSALRVRLDGAPAALLAKNTNLSPAHTRKCLLQLETAGFVRRRHTHIRWGYGRRKVRIWDLKITPQTIAVLARLPSLVPETQPVEEPVSVPPEHWSVFWSGMSAAELRLPEDALHVADTMIGGPSVRARNWALTRLPVETLQQLRTMTGYDDGPMADMLDAAISVRSDG